MFVCVCDFVMLLASEVSTSRVNYFKTIFIYLLLLIYLHGVSVL